MLEVLAVSAATAATATTTRTAATAATAAARTAAAAMVAVAVEPPMKLNTKSWYLALAGEFVKLSQLFLLLLLLL